MLSASSYLDPSSPSAGKGTQSSGGTGVQGFVSSRPPAAIQPPQTQTRSLPGYLRAIPMKSFGVIDKTAEEAPIRTRATASVAESEQEPRSRATDLDDVYDFDIPYHSDDPKDPDFQLVVVKRPHSKAKAADGTPKFIRSFGLKSAPTIQKRRVTAVDPIMVYVCLRTCQNQKSLASSVTFWRALTTLEWWWGMEYWTLYIDTRFNILVLMATWHYSMDGDDWALVPKHDLIARVSQWVAEASSRGPSDLEARKPISETYGRRTFEYYFLPLSKAMENVAIHRYPTGLPGKFTPRAIVPHYHPFSTIGPLTSHVHPHFAIYSVGQKLAKRISQLKGLEDEETKIDDFYTNLAAAASFGHEGDDSELRQIQNRATIDELMSLYTSWSETDGVPQRGSEHPWAHNEKEAEAEEKAEKKAQEKMEKMAAAIENGTVEKMAATIEKELKGKGKMKAKSTK
ncbi:hypothetical protein C8R45DRAFT_1207680 [Mycena sanguinolenta]|nr:hypothetical protein C8R45DRAFT_1207680 [Mycena sanguinolenta]